MTITIPLWLLYVGGGLVVLFLIASRRTHMTVMKRCGAGDMRDQLGHASEQTSAIYLRDTFGMHEAALERFADIVIGRVQ